MSSARPVSPIFPIGVKEQGFSELPYAPSVAGRYAIEAHEKVVEAEVFRLIPLIIHRHDRLEALAAMARPARHPVGLQSVSSSDADAKAL